MVEVDPKRAVHALSRRRWEHFNAEGNWQSQQLISVQALGVDKRIISGLSTLPCRESIKSACRRSLVEFDLSTNRVIRQYDFRGRVSTKDSLTTCRSHRARFAYLTNRRDKGSLVVLDLKTGAAGAGLRSFTSLSQAASDVGEEICAAPERLR